MIPSRMKHLGMSIVMATLTMLVAHAASPNKGVVVSQSKLASEVGAKILREGGNAIDASVATAFALAVTHPTAGNIGGGGFLVFRSVRGQADTYDFRETAPARATADMFVRNGKYDPDLHHESHLS